MEEGEGEVYVPIKQRRAQKLRSLLEGSQPSAAKRPRGLLADSSVDSSKPKKKSLLDERAEMLASGASVALSKEEEGMKEENEILQTIDQGFKPLMSVQELASGVVYSEVMDTGWRPPRAIRELSEAQCQEIRDKWHILVEGEGQSTNSWVSSSLRPLSSRPPPRVRNPSSDQVV